MISEELKAQLEEIVGKKRFGSEFSKETTRRLPESGNAICRLPLESAEDLIAAGKHFLSSTQNKNPDLKKLLPEFPQIALNLANPTILINSFDKPLPEQRNEVDKYLAKLKIQYEIGDIDAIMPDLPTCLELVSHFGLQVTRNPFGRIYEDVFAATTTPIKNTPYFCTVRLTSIKDGLFIGFYDPMRGSSNVVALPVLVPAQPK